MTTLETTATAIPAGTWTADPAHSTFEFGVRHMGIATVKGRFTEVAATLVGGDQPALAGTIAVASVDTHDETRDGHLLSPDFFDAERFPEAHFESTLVGPDRVVGLLTLKGVTREIELAARVEGPGTDPWGNERLGLELEGEIDRHDFGVSWNTPLPDGGFLVGDRVRLTASFSFVEGAQQS
jgi:polyisoprenoid-binding protein YceI